MLLGEVAFFAFVLFPRLRLGQRDAGGKPFMGWGVCSMNRYYSIK